MKKSALIVVVFATLAVFAVGCASKPISAQAPVSKDAPAKEKVSAPNIAETAAKPIPMPSISVPPNDQTIFTLGEVTYKEHPSAKGKIRVNITKPSFRTDGYKYFQGDVQNIAQEVLDATLFAAWKNSSGQIIKEEQIREARFLPGQTAFWDGAIRFLQGANSFEFWIEAKAPKPIPSSVKMSYVEDPSSKGLIKLLDYKIVIQEEGTPFAHWQAVSFTVRNVSIYPLKDITPVLEFDVSDPRIVFRPDQHQGFSLMPNEKTTVAFHEKINTSGQKFSAGLFPYDAAEANLRLNIGTIDYSKPFSVVDFGLSKSGINLLDYHSSQSGKSIRVSTDALRVVILKFSTEREYLNEDIIVYTRAKYANGSIHEDSFIHQKIILPKGTKQHEKEFVIPRSVAMLELDATSFWFQYKTSTIEYKIVYASGLGIPSRFELQSTFSKEQDIEIITQEMRVSGKNAEFVAEIKNVSNRIIGARLIGRVVVQTKQGYGLTDAPLGEGVFLNHDKTSIMKFSTPLDNLRFRDLLQNKMLLRFEVFAQLK